MKPANDDYSSFRKQTDAIMPTEVYGKYQAHGLVNYVLSANYVHVIETLKAQYLIGEMELDITSEVSSAHAWALTEKMLVSKFPHLFNPKYTKSFEGKFKHFFEISDVVYGYYSNSELEAVVNAVSKGTNIHIGMVAFDDSLTHQERRAFKSLVLEKFPSDAYETISCRIDHENGKSITLAKRLGFAPVEVVFESFEDSEMLTRG